MSIMFRLQFCGHHQADHRNIKVK